MSAISDDFCGRWIQVAPFVLVLLAPSPAAVRNQLCISRPNKIQLPAFCSSLLQLHLSLSPSPAQGTFQEPRECHEMAIICLQCKLNCLKGSCVFQQPPACGSMTTEPAVGSEASFNNHLLLEGAFNSVCIFVTYFKWVLLFN